MVTLLSTSELCMVGDVHGLHWLPPILKKADQFFGAMGDPGYDLVG